jgi:hypothetical protein
MSAIFRSRRVSSQASVSARVFKFCSADISQASYYYASDAQTNRPAQKTLEVLSRNLFVQVNMQSVQLDVADEVYYTNYAELVPESDIIYGNHKLLLCAFGPYGQLANARIGVPNHIFHILQMVPYGLGR